MTTANRFTLCPQRRKTTRPARRRLSGECLEDRRLLSASAAGDWSIAELNAVTGRPIAPTAGVPTNLPQVPGADDQAPVGVAADLSLGSTYMTPEEVRRAYGLEQPLPAMLGGATLDGAGQTITIVDAYDDPTVWSDLAQFDNQFGLPSPPQEKETWFELNGQKPPGNADWATETALDIEWAHAMAPGASILLVHSWNDTPAEYFKAVAWAAQQPDVSVVSMSYGLPEFAGENAYDPVFTTPAGHEGVTFVAASGDRDAGHGYYPTDTTGRYPSSSPDVVSVGAAALATDNVGDYLGEGADPISGGGFSPYEAEPNYQRSVLSGTRSTPDIAWADAPVGDFGIPIYDSYETASPLFEEAGTSASAPQFAGLIATADEGRALRGEATLDGPGQTLPLLYELSSSFHDITQFASMPPDHGLPAFSPHPGYDPVTGLGTPIGNILVPQLVNGSFLSLWTEASPDANTTLTVGTTLDNELASFSDPNGDFSPGSYFATINWGDGTATIATVAWDTNGNLEVFGSHEYSAPGSYEVEVQVLSPHSLPTGDSFYVTATNPPLQATGGFHVSATEGQAFTNEVVGLFTDPLNSGTYTATVNFGDGMSAPGTIVVEGSGLYEVLASHTYTSGAVYETITVTITRTSDGNTATVESGATVLGGGPMPSNLAALAQQLTHDSDYYGAFVTWAYQQFMGRTPDAAGLSYWVGQLQNDLTDEQLESQFLSAPEYIADHGGSDVNWVIGMYHDLLGRAPDSQGLAYWTSKIESGEAEYSIALGFAASAEREAIVISQDYLNYLGRSATENDINYWVNQFLNGARNEDVIAGFIGAPEYYNDPKKGAGQRTLWLDSVFEDLYQQSPTAAERNQWLAEMEG